MNAKHMNTVTNETVTTEQENPMSMAHPATASVEGATPSPIYALQAVIREYQQKNRKIRALAGVDLEIREGEFVTIQGPTGGGKSTLLQMLGALDRPSSGVVKLGDVDLEAGTERKKASELDLKSEDSMYVPFSYLQRQH